MSVDLLEQKTLIDDYLQRRPQALSAFSFTNLWTWKDFFEFRIEMIHNNLCLFAKNSLGCFLYLPPLGETVSPETVEECFHRMNQENRNSGVTRIEHVTEHHRLLFPEDRYHWYKKGYEYYYFRKDVVTLKGNAYKTKRAAYNYFVKNYKHEFVPYEEKMHDECMMLYGLWAVERMSKYSDPIYQQMVEENRSVLRLALGFYKKLGLVGRVVVVDEQLKAFTLGYPLTDNVFCVIFEITDLTIKGLSVYIFREFCADKTIQPFKFINVMDDFELSNIAKTKLSFRPIMLVPSYVVTKK